MLFRSLTEATLLRRYKRFLADVRLPCGTEVTAHCPNPGSMLGLAQPGMRVLLWQAPPGEKARKLKWSWKFVEADGAMVCVDTMLANKLFKEAFTAGRLPEFSGYSSIEAEHKYEDSRFDFFLQGTAGSAMVEVKSVSLLELSEQGEKVAAFPDARTERGLKHLETLRSLSLKGADQAVQFYVVARGDTRAFKPADSIDPAYGRALRQAYAQGVAVHCRALEIKLEPCGEHCFDLEMTLAETLPLLLKEP